GTGLTPAPLSVIAHIACNPSGLNGWILYMATPTHLFGIAIGSALAAAVRLGWATAFLRRSAAWIALLGAAIFFTGYGLGGFQVYFMDAVPALCGIVGTGL